MKLSDLTAYCERERLVDPELFVEADNGGGTAIINQESGLFVDDGRTSQYVILQPAPEDDS